MDKFVREGRKEYYILDGREMTIETAVIYLQKQGFDKKETFGYLKQLFNDYQQELLRLRDIY